MPGMPDGAAPRTVQEPGAEVVGVFRGPWNTGWTARDGAVIGFEDIYLAFAAAADAGELSLATAEFDIFRSYRRIKEFLASCDVVYANCGPWTALLLLVREREQLNVRIIREVRTIGWVGYIWQEEVAGRLARAGDQRVFPSRYARDIWDAAMPGTSPARVFYPLIRSGAGRTACTDPASGTAGFFSVLSRDKGFSSLPDVISHMRESGHRIDRVVLAGKQADPDLYGCVVNRLSEIGVTVDYRGGLPHDEVRALMSTCDFVFFLTMSSIESLGRVMVEAAAQKVPVITADFGAAMDLVSTQYRIPVCYPDETSGLCNNSFPLGRLALENWKPPQALTADACYLPSIDKYLADGQRAPDILRPLSTEQPAEPRPLHFSFSCEVDSMELAHKLLNELDFLHSKPIHELVDLGGALKQYLVANDYNPEVNFTSKPVPSPESTNTW